MIMILILQLILQYKLQNSRIILISLANMKQQQPSKATQSLICQQIDVVIMGSKTFQLLQILLDRNLNLVPMPALKNKYLQTLSSLFPEQSNLAFQPTDKFAANMTESKIQMFTTNVLTQSFWLQFNFFYLGALAHDPLLAPLSRHKIPLCIIASSQHEPDNPTLKSLLTSQCHPHSDIPLTQPLPIDNKYPSRIQFIMQQKIINLLHNFKLNQFASVLSLKFIDRNRIIESSSGLKLGRNQILRWIVDRYFQCQFGVKLRGEVGDQIQNYEEKKDTTACYIM